MDNNTPNMINKNSFSVKDLFFKCLRKWYWFVLSAIICFGFAFIYLSTVNKKYKVETTILLRTDNSGPALLDKSLIDLEMGVVNKDVEDEMQLLKSQKIIRNVISELNIQTEYFQKEGWRTVELYPLIPIRLFVPAQFNDTSKYSAIFKIDCSEKGYTVRFSYVDIKAEYQLSSLSEGVRTPVGEFKFKQILPLKGKGTYKIIAHPIHNLIEDYCEVINVVAVLKRSNAISIATNATCVKKAQAFLDKLVELYNQYDADNKNELAKVTAHFIDERLNLIGKELQSVDTELEINKNNVDLLRQKQIKQKLHLFLLQKREENALSLASAISSAKTIDNAYISIEPVSPKIYIILLLALVLSLGIPTLILYIKDSLNDKIRSKAELLQLLKIPFLGSIAFSKSTNGIVVKEGEMSPVAEMYRLIRTNLQFQIGDTQSPVLLVTSTISGEGKTISAINIAMSFALTKKKVAFVGLDLRKPMLAEYLQISNDKGVSLFLSDSKYKVEDIIVPSNLHPFLSVIPAGTAPPNPAELLLSPRLDELILKLKEEFDYIILDSAPVGIVSDTYLLNRLIDSCICIVRQNFTSREACGLINKISTEGKLNKVSVVLNGTDESIGFGSGYGYGYSSGKIIK